MSDAAKGILAMLGATLIWGLAPIYYKYLGAVPALELFSHRALWSLIFFAAILGLQGRHSALGTALSGATLRPLILSAAMIAVNWGLFIWAVLAGRATEASLGYFIYPLIAVALGMVFLGERLTRAQQAALALASLAVGVLTWGLGHLPWIALVLATSFSFYSLVKKGLDVGPVVSVTAETLLLAPGVLAILWYFHSGGGGFFGSGWEVSLLLALSGPLTATPLILFSYAARRTRLSTLGLMQYLNPTLQFLVAVLIFAEPFGVWHAIAFPMIWLALALYSVSALRADRASRRRSSASAADPAV